MIDGEDVNHLYCTRPTNHVAILTKPTTVALPSNSEDKGEGIQSNVNTPDKD